MIVLSDGRFQEEFLSAVATTNLRALMRTIAPDEALGGRSHSDLLEAVNSADPRVTREEFTRAVAELAANAEQGAYHFQVLANSPLIERGGAERLCLALDSAVAYSGPADRVETRQVLAATVVEGSATSPEAIEVLYLDDDKAEIRTAELDREVTEHGETYRLKAYRLAEVPVIGKVRLSLAPGGSWIYMRPVHRGAAPQRAIDQLRSAAVDWAGCDIPARIGLGDGLHALLIADEIIPRSLTAEEEDGCKVHYKRAASQQNTTSREAETIIKGWEQKQGGFILDGVSFYLSVEQSVFRFGAGVSIQGALRIVHRIFDAA